MKKTEVFDHTLDIAKKIARDKEGALFVIAPKSNFKKTYDPLYTQIVPNFSVSKKGIKPVIEKLATLDGATLVSDKGNLIAYGAKLKKTKPLIGFGTRHAAATGITSSIKEATAILVSEESNWVRIFKNGRIILEIDPKEKVDNTIKDKVLSFVTDGDTALLTAAGISAAFIGLAPTLIIGGTYIALKTTSGLIRKSIKKSH